jgi:hypothetical protein
VALGYSWVTEVQLSRYRCYFSAIKPLVKPFLLYARMSLFLTLAEYFMYSHLPNFLYIAAMLCCSEDEENFDEDFI